MPIDFGSWLGQANSLVASQWQLRAQVQWARIQDKETDISLFRNGVELSPQTVRIELYNTITDANDESGVASIRDAIVFGIRGHPTLDDTDIKVWDTFVYEDVEYTVRSVNLRVIGQVQAFCESVG